MSRTKGARSAGHEERRAALLKAFRERLLARNLPPPSLRELAAAAGVTIPTVRHYFGRREDLIEALLADLGDRGQVYLARARNYLRLSKREAGLVLNFGPTAEFKRLIATDGAAIAL